MGIFSHHSEQPFHTVLRDWMLQNIPISLIYATAQDVLSGARCACYFLKTLTSSEAMDVTIPMKENQMVVELPIPEFLAFTVFGST